MEFKFIDHNDPLLTQVIQLGKKNSSTLGLMPKDAYIQQARKKCIVVAIDADQLLGYCLFRVVDTKRRVGITQLCINSIHRRKGLAKLLLNQVRDKYKSLLKGMLVSCREDYKEACILWNNYGFVSKNRIRSRSVQERYLIKFWYSFDQKDLFTIEENPNDLRVVLDLNILIKLREQEKSDTEISQLLSDWLTDEVDYCYAKETLTEIHRDKDFERTKNTIQFLGTFQELTCNPTESQQYLSMLCALHPGETDNHISDRKQLAECKASNISYFITIDEELISNSDDIYEKLGVSILRPSEFILEIDELKNRRLYEPIRLHGARYEVKRIDKSVLVASIDTFLNKESAEKKSEFRDLVLSVVSDTLNSCAKIVSSPDGNIVSFYGIRIDLESLDIVFVRNKKLPLSNTLFNQILVEIIHEAISRGKQIIKFLEKNVSSEQKSILINNGFSNLDDHWIKIVLHGVCDTSNLISKFPIIRSNSELERSIESIADLTDYDTKEKLKLEVERKIWPLKLTDLIIPVFIVPIKPVWAAQLFDFISANTSLFGAAPELTWNKENVYYRSNQPNVETFPGRILWYASQENGFIRQKAIVACSYLDNVVIGEAKKLYSIFRRFGIYKWPEINSLAKGDIHKLIKVLQFSDTEVFEQTVSFKAVNGILLNEGFKEQTFVSPVKVNNQVFNRIYSLAKGIA